MTPVKVVDGRVVLVEIVCTTVGVTVAVPWFVTVLPGEVMVTVEEVPGLVVVDDCEKVVVDVVEPGAVTVVPGPAATNMFASGP